MKPPTSIDLNRLVQRRLRTTITLRVTGGRMLRVRAWLARRLADLAAWVLPGKITIVTLDRQRIGGPG